MRYMHLTITPPYQGCASLREWHLLQRVRNNSRHRKDIP